MVFVLCLSLVSIQSVEELQAEASRLYQEGKLIEAAALLEGLLQKNPSLEPARLQLGTAYLRLGRRDEARDIFNGIVAQYPDTAEVAYRIGVLYFLAKELADARALLERAVELDPGHVEAALTLGQLEGQAGNHDRALALLADVSRRAPELPAPYYYRAAILDITDRPAAAIEALEAGLSLVPTDARFHRLLGALYSKLQQWPAAEDALKNALRYGAVTPDVFLDLGRVHLSQEQLVPARAAFEKTRELAPDLAEPYLQLGYIAWRLSDYEEAVRLLDACITRDPALMRAYHFMGLIALRKRDFDRAERYFIAALERDPRFAEAHFNLGKISLRRNAPEVAVEHFEKALKIQPDYKEVYYQMGFAYRRLGQADLAAQALARFEELSSAPR